MNPAEFANIAAAEESFWWFQGMNRMLWDFLDPHHPSSGIALELGTRTGGNRALMLERYTEYEVV
ncbi:MAG: hypothetical protein KJZ70_05620 [Bryobacterales bacterium]|nr:hypothetical protein [Bryobacterales bacterium]